MQIAQFHIGNVYHQKKTVHLVNRPLSDLESQAIEINSDFVVLGVKPKVSHRLGALPPNYTCNPSLEDSRQSLYH